MQYKWQHYGLYVHKYFIRVTFFNYKRFVDSDAESILYPLALPLKDNNEDTEVIHHVETTSSRGYIYWLLLTDYDLIKEYFEFDLAFDANGFQCLKTLTEEQLSNGFPLWVSYYLFQ